MGRHPHRHRIETGAEQQRQAGLRPARQHKRQRAGPEAAGNLFRQRVEMRDLLRGFKLCHMHDQRVELRSPLGGEDTGHRPFIRRIRAEAVNGFGGEGDELPGAQKLCRFGDCSIVGRFDVGRFHHPH